MKNQKLFLIMFYPEAGVDRKDADCRWGKNEEEVWEEFKKEDSNYDIERDELHEIKEAVNIADIKQKRGDGIYCPFCDCFAPHEEREHDHVWSCPECFFECTEPKG